MRFVSCIDPFFSQREHLLSHFLNLRLTESANPQCIVDLINPFFNGSPKVLKRYPEGFKKRIPKKRSRI